MTRRHHNFARQAQQGSTSVQVSGHSPTPSSLRRENMNPGQPLWMEAPRVSLVAPSLGVKS